MTFKKHYINIVEKSCGNKPKRIATILGSLNDSDFIDRVTESHPKPFKCVKN